jgi:hypothetical protein
MINVGYLAKAEIEKEAQLLLSEYQETIGESVKLPVPVRDITTSHLALDLRFGDLHQIFGRTMLRDLQPDILGAIWIDKDLIAIDHRLDPSTNPEMLGRYNFSVAHEIGHWWLHRSYSAESTEMCRSTKNTEPLEWQGNYFASCLLMPRQRVLEVWNALLGRRGDTDDLLLVPLGNGTVLMHSQAMTYAQRNELGMSHDYVCSVIARPIADRFGVSVQAMRIRLEELELLPTN